MALAPKKGFHVTRQSTLEKPAHHKPAVPLFSVEGQDKENGHNHNKKHPHNDKENLERVVMDEIPNGIHNSKEGAPHPVTVLPPKEERLLQNSWPKEYIRLRYPLVARKSFGPFRLLKTGGLSVVYHSLHLPTRTDMVLKVLMEKDDWNNEIRGYSNSKKNPAVVQLIAVMALSACEANQLCHGVKGYVPRETHEAVGVMVFERWNASLRDAIDAGQVREWGLLTSVGLMKDVARAVAFMHKNDVMHRDIKPDNILYRTIGTKKSAGLCDLGLATKVVTERGDQRDAFTQGVGTNKYMAPECAKGTEYTVAADVYSLAVTIWEVCIAACRLRTQLPEHLSRLVKKGSASRHEDRLDSRKFYTMMKRIYKFLEKKEGNKTGYIDVYQSDTPSDCGDPNWREKEFRLPDEPDPAEGNYESDEDDEEEGSEEDESEEEASKKKRGRSKSKSPDEVTLKRRKSLKAEPVESEPKKRRHRISDEGLPKKPNREVPLRRSRRVVTPAAPIPRSKGTRYSLRGEAAKRSQKT